MLNFKDRIVYEVYIKSFYDSNNDGIGDIQGVIEKLDYIKNLGINSLWITPFYKSPMVDEGYDISDYKTVNKTFGTINDIKKLIKEAEIRGIDIMCDFVLNHTSSEHEWFQKALKGDKKYQDYYFFEDEPKTEWVPRFGGDSCWEYVPALDKYYLHLYDRTQPDLNWDNPQVRKEMFEVVDFWVKLGIKAYKFDVLYLISKPTDNNWKPSGKIACAEAVRDGKHVHEYIRELMTKIKSKYPNTYSVGEMSFSKLDECIKYSNPKSEEIDIVQTGRIIKVNNVPEIHGMESPDNVQIEIYLKNIKKWIQKMQDGGGWLCNFTANHDSSRSVSRFGSKKYWAKSSKMISLYTLSLWGTPFFIQGDEIGMMNPIYKSPNDYVDIKSKTFIESDKAKKYSSQELVDLLSRNGRDSGRSTMIWDKTKNGGWSKSDNPWRKPTLNQFAMVNVNEDRKSIV